QDARQSRSAPRDALDSDPGGNIDRRRDGSPRQLARPIDFTDCRSRESPGQVHPRHKPLMTFDRGHCDGYHRQYLESSKKKRADRPVHGTILISSGKEPAMPLFEVETTSHIMIACVTDEPGARAFAAQHYPSEDILRVSHRPRDAWVISKKLLGIAGNGD